DVSRLHRLNPTWLRRIPGTIDDELVVKRLQVHLSPADAERAATAPVASLRIGKPTACCRSNSRLLFGAVSRATAAREPPHDCTSAVASTNAIRSAREFRAPDSSVERDDQRTLLEQN